MHIAITDDSRSDHGKQVDTHGGHPYRREPKLQGAPGRV
ncbi:hypothetical protein PC116_g21101 [Phytophthora cactorum]|nr:hypothetical protein PC116_g21101 [Phytophthora cactorum]